MARFELEPQVPETGLQSLGRNISRSISRAGEALVGGIGSFARGATGIASLGEQILEKNAPEFLKGQLPKPFTAINEALSILPTTEELRERSKEKPQGYYEQLSDNLISDFVEYANPLLGPLKVGAKAAAVLSGAGNLASFAAKNLGFGETGQQVAKIGSVLATSLMGIPRAETYKNSLYEAARTALPADASVSSSLVSPAIRKVEQSIAKGHAGTSEKQALKFLKSVSDKINPATKEIPLESVWELKKNINDMVYKSSLVAETKAAQKHLRPLQEALIETLKQSESKYPAFAKNLMTADEIHRALNSTSKIGRFLTENVKLESLKDPRTAVLLGIAQYAGLPTLKAGAGAFAAKQAYLAAESLAKSPAIRKHYANAISSALKKNATATFKNVRLLDEAIRKESPEEEQGRYVLD